MKRPRLKSLLLVATLIIATAAVVALGARGKPVASPIPPPPSHYTSTGDGILKLSGHLVQTQVLKGSAGNVGLELILTADDAAIPAPAAADRGIDFVVVLDRSGSMQGVKLEHARQALYHLLAGLTGRDRFALFSYSDTVQQDCGLLPVDDLNRMRMLSAVDGVYAGGATNLGGGLRAGIDLLAAAVRPGHPGRVVLISDGLANRGVTDPAALGGIAAAAAGREFSVSTVGVGADFNEFLMTRIADRGAGSYYYLENPSAFAEVLQKEFLAARSAAATGIAVRIPLPAGVRLADAAGYPVTVSGGAAVFYPGSLRSGQTRRMFLTFQIPTDQERSFDIGRISVAYQRGGERHETALGAPFTVACVDDETSVFSSIDRPRWERKVLVEDYNRLKQEVAADISAGKMDGARGRIERYEKEQRTLNSVVQSPEVSKNLENDLEALRKRVDETFQGPPAAVMEKQKSNAKALQYEGYTERRTTK